MQAFARLYDELDASTSTAHKVAVLQAHLREAEPADAAWAVYFLAGGKPRQAVPTALLRASAITAAGIPDWLFEECYQAAGDLAETIAHVVPPGPAAPADATLAGSGLAEWVEERIAPLRGLPPGEQAARLAAWWPELDARGRFLLVKLIGGGFRVGVSRLLVQRALAEVAGIDAKLVAQRMMGWTDARRAPDAARYLALLAAPGSAREGDDGQPYPFYLAHPVDAALDAAAGDFDAALGAPGQWLVEWKVDGIRAQVVRRAGGVWIWSRGEELITDRFPEVAALAHAWPDGTVVDGEIVVWPGCPAGRPAPFATLQQRIGRKTLPRKLLAEAPATLLAYDLLEDGGVDIREQPLAERRRRLEALAAAAGVPLSPQVQAPSWRAFAALRRGSRERGVEGFMLKHIGSAYGIGRRKADAAGAAGGWWKWKIEPMTADAVLIYAQRGHGRRASVYTDYTFAVWSRPPADADEAAAVVQAIAERRPPVPGGLQLLPFAKAYSGLSDEEFAQVDRVIRGTTVDSFGPVRSVRPTLVFELGFEGIGASARHKSGIAVRFPRMLRLRPDKPLHEADTLAALQELCRATTSTDAQPRPDTDPDPDPDPEPTAP